MRFLRLSQVACCMFAALFASQAHATSDPVQVFILAGQSNMVGKGSVEVGLDPSYTYDFAAAQQNGYVQPQTVGGLGSLRAMVADNWATYGSGGTNPLVSNTLAEVQNTGIATLNWTSRSDVNVYEVIDNNIEKGNLTTGFGSGTSIGPEYGFGQVVGNALGQDVLIIKIATGGTSLYTDWRPPTAVADRGGSVGAMWTQMVTQVNDVLSNLDTEFAEYAGRGYNIAGFGWHQGWNDGGGGAGTITAAEAEYEDNLADLIADVRSAEHGFGISDLPFVIANTGTKHPTNGSIRQVDVYNAQNNIGDPGLHPEFVGNVTVVDTAPFFRNWDASPKNETEHWNRNGITYYDIGRGMGDAMVALVPEPGSLSLLAMGGVLLMRRRRDRTFT